ncbi:AraC-type DNA-binding protein [Luteibacter sp. UNC138MFCol5.1]|uniref:helix-turn-helix transcriptional regulator n=1 Tax=Luteibacter sp. UNC138MFCol5.1 TaxID=1502774 RepID=UPI0008BAECC2|nr:AraC family transcriptional regulator [Luteibacter sp. UNC138MFCol5.1]SEO91133.1 AraC-type DNA-binding protein [Luteibacter sp. UNC138MFCol5.1]
MSSMLMSSVEDALTLLLQRARVDRVQPSDAFVEHLSNALVAARDAAGAPLDAGASSVRGGLATWQLRLAFEHLTRELDASRAVQGAAQACRTSRGHFSRAFKASTGVSPSRWHMERRIREAERLLAQRDIPLVEIAARCGFSDQSHFTNVFSRLRHVSPGAWRRRKAA